MKDKNSFVFCVTPHIEVLCVKLSYHLKFIQGEYTCSVPTKVGF